jgi:hypothetical protein
MLSSSVETDIPHIKIETVKKWPSFSILSEIFRSFEPESRDSLSVFLDR